MVQQLPSRRGDRQQDARSLPRFHLARPHPCPAEAKKILEAAHETARQLLTERKTLVERIARRLLEDEVLEGDELRRLLTVAASTQPHSDGPVRHIVPKDITT